MIEGQLKQIVVLQKEIELVRQGQTITNSCSQSQLQPTASKQEVDGLKYQIDDLVHERDNLVEMAQNFEGQFKESHQNMQQAISRVQELEKELEEKVTESEELRERITQVAELFEKKQIKQKYSFDVLCDFIHDKAKRLYTKYETVSRERKVMQEEKSFYFQRKLD